MNNQNDSKTPLVAISDLGLATAISLQYPLEFIDKSNPRKALFVFKKEDGVTSTVTSYWNGELRVNPVEYFNQLKSIKTRLYNELERKYER